MRPLVLGLGNPADGGADDAVGILAARDLSERLGAQADVVESSLSGLALLDLLIGYRRAAIFRISFQLYRQADASMKGRLMKNLRLYPGLMM